MKVTIREAEPADAEGVIQHVQQLAVEPGIYIALWPSEFYRSVEEEQQIIADMATADNSLFLVAEAEEGIVGTLTCKGGHRRATQHAATIGMSVAKEWRGYGIGNMLMEYLIDWAKASGSVIRLELLVFAENEIAINLYRKFGFEVEGRGRKALYVDGQYHDNLIMARLL